MVNSNGFKLWQVVVAFVVGGAIVGSGFMVSGGMGKGLMGIPGSAGPGSFAVDPAKADAYLQRKDVAITRCELAKLLVENLGLSYESLDSGPHPGGTVTGGLIGFDDVSADCRTYVDLVVANNIMAGKTVHTFEPHGNVTRAELIKYVNLGFGLPENLDHVNQFSDTTTHWVNYSWLSTAYHWGLLAKNREACYPREFFPDQIAKKNWAKMVIKNAKDPYAID